MNNMEELDTGLIVRSLNYHGQQLTKLWDCEQGPSHLAQLNITNLDYHTYSQRQKGLIFQERVKRLQLHEFIAKNAQRLFHADLTKKEEVKLVEDKSKKAPLQKYAQLPPYESFLNIEKSKKIKHFFQYAKVGSLIVGTLTSKNTAGVSLRVLYLEADTVLCVPDLNIKAFCYTKHLQFAVVDQTTTRPYQVNDNIRCEILELVPETEKFIVGTRGSLCSPELATTLGYVSSEDCHVAYRVFMEYNRKDSYPEVLDKSAGFYNPKNVENLSNELQLGSENTPSHFMELKGEVPQSELAPELRQQQANKWSMKSVAEGIAYFKAGKFTEAFQCLNKALSIDPNNVEGLTARGALYANNGNFAKAIGDFETALKINPGHVNARKYLGETLVARGRSLEEESKYDDAIKSYEACLRIVPFHEEATNSIKYLKDKMVELEENTDLTSSLPPLNITSKVNDVKTTLKQLLAEEKEREGKKKKEKKKRKRHSSSSSSSSSSDDVSSDSSISSSSSDSSQDSGRKKKKKKKKIKKGGGGNYNKIVAKLYDKGFRFGF
uniref:Tetratricopeptide repeat protein 14 homolog n=2 Tax=Cacopsylla melanoneura TaxID=428564 RepID=A0A8D8UYB4_9HEMI